MANAVVVVDRGDAKVVPVTVTVGGVATDPSTVTCKVRQPTGTTTTYVYGTDVEVTRTSTGVYTITITFDAAGRWFVRWIGTGDAIYEEEQEFFVRRSNV